MLPTDSIDKIAASPMHRTDVGKISEK